MAEPVPAQDLNTLHNRYVDLSNRFKAAWSFHQFLQGLHKLLMDGEVGQFGADFQAVYGFLKEVSQNLNAASTTRIRNELDMVERRLQELTRWLLQEDSKISPSLMRLFFQRVRNQNDAILVQLVRFYLYVHPKVDWSQDHHDKTDFLVTRLTEESEGAPPVWRIKSPTQARETFDGLWRMTGAVATAEDVANARERIAALGRSIRQVETLDELLERQLIPQYRRLKLGLGSLFFHPDVLVAVVETNLELRNHIQGLYRREERIIVADYQRIFELEQQVSPPGDLAAELAAFREEVEQFEANLASDSLSLAELGRLRDRVKRLVPQLTHMRDGEDLFSRSPSLAPPEPATPAVAAAREGHAPTEGSADPFQGLYDEIWATLQDNDEGADPRAFSLNPQIYPYRLEGREIVAFRRLAHDEPGIDRALEELLLRAAAVRVQAAAEIDGIRSILDDTSVTREAPIFAQARSTLRAATGHLGRLGGEVERAVAEGRLRDAQEFQILRMRLLREYAELWLRVQR